jgi:hypothetical protein
MLSSIIYLLVFIITSIIYFLVKDWDSTFSGAMAYLDPATTDKTPDANYTSTDSTVVKINFAPTDNRILYFLLIVISQVSLNAGDFISQCNGDVANLQSIFFMSFVPWIFIFGVLIFTINQFPNFKSVFSNVVGPFFIASKANELLNNLSNKVNGGDAPTVVPVVTPIPEFDITKITLEKFKDDILNQPNITNLPDLTTITNKTLMASHPEVKSQILSLMKLFKLIKLKENIGEFMWYLYSAILVNAIVQYNMVNTQCV